MNNFKANVGFITFTVLLDAIGLGLVIPILPDVIRRFNSDATFVSDFYGYFIAVYALMQFLASPVLGALSDRFGRRPILLNSLLGAGLDYILMAYAPTLSILFIGRIIAGLTGASITVATSYMADVSSNENRAANFGLIGAAFGVGFIIGPVLGGFLGKYGYQVSFLVTAGLTLLNFIFGLFVLPESLPNEKRRKIEIKKINPFSSIAKIFLHPTAWALVLCFFLLNLAGQSHPSIWTLYTQYKFGWTTFDVGLSLTMVGIMMGIGQGVLTRLIIPSIGEAKTCYLSIVTCAVGFLLYAMAETTWMMYAIMITFLVSSMAGPALQSMISMNTPQEEQGELQGSLMALASFTAIIGPIIYTKLFSFYTKPELGHNIPGMPYYFAAFFCLVGLFFAMKKPGPKLSTQVLE